MRDLTASGVAWEVGLSRSQVARIAHSIPGHRLTKGGHHRFRDCPALRNWIAEKTVFKDWITEPLERVDDYYSTAFLKKLQPLSALEFVTKAKATILNLEQKMDWVSRRFDKKR